MPAHAGTDAFRFAKRLIFHTFLRPSEIWRCVFRYPVVFLHDLNETRFLACILQVI